MLCKYAKKNNLSKKEFDELKNFIAAAATAVRDEIAAEGMKDELVRFEALEAVKNLSVIDKKLLIGYLKHNGSEFYYNNRYIVF